MTADFSSVLAAHFEAIAQRDINAFSAHLGRDETLYTVVQNGHAFTTKSESIALHRQWFEDPDWLWQGRVVRQVVGSDLAMALIQYDYRPSASASPVSSWLTYVFELQDGAWRLIHDHNTACDYPAFARMAGIDLNR